MSVDKSNAEHHGAHWTVEQVESATAEKAFAKGVNKWDKFVAYNALWHDLNSVLDDAKILEVAYVFWFADKDWKTPGKIWDYMAANK